MKILAISDTHCRHRDLDLPAADILIHAGDALIDGTEEEFVDFRDWLVRQPYRHMIKVGGNHDDFEQDHPDCWNGTGVHYLLDSEVTVAGLRVYGSPHRVVPDERFERQNKSGKKWSAFMVNETWGEHLWRSIPYGLDVLVTHMPPRYIRDRAYYGAVAQAQGHPPFKHWGSKALRRAVERARPRVHIFGHIHDEPGVSVGSGATHGTIFVNVATCDSVYVPRLTHRVFEWPEVV